MILELRPDQKFRVVSEPKRLILSGRPRTVVSCICDCGEPFLGRVDHIMQDLPIKSCGCLKQEHMKRGGHNRKPSGHAAAGTVYNSYRSKCRRKGIVFEISLPDFMRLTQCDCHYCGARPSAQYGEFFKKGVRAGLRKVNGTFVYNGIDRIVPELGYVDGNMLPCCAYCNSAKGARSYAEFIDWISRLVEFRRLNGHT